MFRETYCHKKAVEMYLSGKTEADIKKMLTEENADASQLSVLAERYYKDYKFILKDNNRILLKKAEKDIAIGGVLFVGGALLSLLTYLVAKEGHHFVILDGMILVGLFFLVRGFIAKNNLKKEDA